MEIKLLAKQIYLAIVLGFAFSMTAFAQTDAEKFAEGRVALDKFKDCPAALKALETVSEEGRKNPLWAFYMAKVHECLSNNEEAIEYYKKYDALIPGQVEILEKIVEIRYQSNPSYARKLFGDLVNSVGNRSSRLASDRLNTEPKITEFGGCIISLKEEGDITDNNGVSRSSSTWTIRLSDIDPTSIKVQSDMSTGYFVSITTRAEEKTIKETRYFSYLGRSPEKSDTSWAFFSFYVGDQEKANRAAKALSQVVKACLKEAPTESTPSRTPPAPSGSAAERYSLGLKLVEAGKYEEAIVQLNEAIRLDRNNAQAYVNRGYAYWRLSKYELAIEDLNEAIRLDTPSKANGYSARGRVYVDLGNYEQAIKDYNEAVRLNPRSEEAYFFRGLAYRNVGRYERSIEDYNDAIRFNSRSARAYSERSLTYLILARGVSASADARAYLDLEGWKNSQSQYMVLLAFFGYHRDRNDAEAARLLAEAATKCDTSAWPYAIIRYLRHEVTDAELLKMATDNDKMTEVRAYLGLDLTIAGHRQEALTHLTWVKANGNKNFIEYPLAVAEIERLAR